MLAYPSSTVHAIWAPAMDILSVTSSQVDMMRFPGGVFDLWSWRLLLPLAAGAPLAPDSLPRWFWSCLPRAAGHAI